MTEQLKICGKLLRQERADSECRYIYINPNGPEAVGIIKALYEALIFARDEIKRLRDALEIDGEVTLGDAALSLARNGEPPVSSLGGQ